MRKTALTLFFLAVLPFCPDMALAQMTESQIREYAKEQVAHGKSNSQIGQELMARGVTAEQLSDLYRKIGNDSSDIGDSSTEGGSALPVSDNVHVRTAVPEISVPDKAPGGDDGIFGHDVFKSGSRLSFEPNENMATPKDYVIGPGDEIIIDIWGTSEATIKKVVSAEGRINITQIGPVQLSGLTIDQATGKLKKVLSQKYTIQGQGEESGISVTLGNVRSIKVNVLGEVNIPGTYRLSSLSTVFNALYMAGGVTGIGSLRNVRVVRAGKTLCTLDLYDYLFDGNGKNNVSLTDDDAIIVPPYTSIVSIDGGVKRPMKYEMLPDEPVSEILRFAGGFASDANTKELVVTRRDGDSGLAILVPCDNFGSFGLMDGDVVSVNVNQITLYENSVGIKGSVLRPGQYALGNEIATVRQLVNHAGGLLDDAFMPRAQIVREKPDRSLEILSIAIGAIMDGTEPDVMLKRNDILTVSNLNQIERKGNVEITGYVNNPGSFTYNEGMEIEDLILLAGGLQEGASTLRAEVSRRIDVSDSNEAQDTLARLFMFTIQDGLYTEGRPEFSLQPNDIVSIRKSPTYVPQKQVRISGEVTFPGYYTLETANERLSDLMRRAGGATPNAFVAGALLKRRVTEAEKDADIDLLAIAGNQADSLNIMKMDADVYNVGIDLDKALARPGSDYDVVLGEGDELIVPPLVNTVKIRGEVFYPNSVNYMPGMSVKDYIRQAGGFSNDARRLKVYVVYMNGKVARGRFAKVKPGSEIIVPNKPERSKLSIGEWVGIGSTVASLSTVMITVMNLYR